MEEYIKVPNGLYHVETFSDGMHRAEKIKGVWYWSDGTGWKAKIEYPEEIIKATDISDLPDYKNTSKPWWRFW